MSEEKQEEFFLGIDEAGRGPVLGPMVYGACWCPRSRLDDLKALGVMDSKALTEATRDRLFEKIKESSYLGWSVDVISADSLSRQMLRRNKRSLNAISHDAAIGLIERALAAGINVVEVFVDTVGISETYQAKLSGMFPTLKFHVEKQADATYPVVSAASICAKVTRDNAIRDWSHPEGLEELGVEYGSGYPGDERARSWLKRATDPIFGYPKLVRFSWKPVQEAMTRDAIQVDTYDDEDEDVPANQGRITDVFTSRQKRMRHRYFADRNIHPVTDL